MALINCQVEKVGNRANTRKRGLKWVTGLSGDDEIFRLDGAYNQGRKHDKWGEGRFNK